MANPGHSSCFDLSALFGKSMDHCLLFSFEQTQTFWILENLFLILNTNVLDIGISFSDSCLCAIGGCYATLFRKCGFPKICPSGAKSKVQDHIYSVTKTTVEIIFLKDKPSLQKIKHCSDFYLLSLINRFSI